MSSYMLAHLCGWVTGGHRPGTSFKNVHWNCCAMGQAWLQGQYAKGSSDPLATQVVDLEEQKTNKDVAPNEEVGQSCTSHESAAPKLKKAKTDPSPEDRMVATIMASSERLVISIEKLASDANPAIDGLWDEIKELPALI